MRLLLALPLLLLLAACHSDAEPPAPPAGEPIRLIFQHQRMFGDPEALDSVLRDFERGHPGVVVVSQALPGESSLMHQLHAVDLEAGAREPDVFSVDVVWVAEFARAGWIADLSERFPPERMRRDFLRAAAESAVWRGRAWAVPWFADVGLLYWRKDLLERHGLAPPRTWDDLEREARTILERERPARPRLTGLVWQGRQYEGLVCCALEAIRGEGGLAIDAGGRPLLERPEAQRALARLRRLVADGVSPAHTTSADEEAARRIFEGGGAVFMRNWPYALALLERPGSPVRGKVGAGPIPGGGTLGGWHLAVNARIASWKREAALALLEHLASPAVERRMLAAYGLDPPRPGLLEGPSAKALEAAFEGARPRPVTPYWLMISDVLQSELSATVAGIRSPEESARRASRRIEQIAGEGAEAAR